MHSSDSEGPRRGGRARGRRDGALPRPGGWKPFIIYMYI